MIKTEFLYVTIYILIVNSLASLRIAAYNQKKEDSFLQYLEKLHQFFDFLLALLVLVIKNKGQQELLFIIFPKILILSQ